MIPSAYERIPTMSKKRRYFSPQEKVAVVRQHLLKRMTIAQVCEQYTIDTSVVYRWKKVLLDHGATAFAQCKANDNGRGRVVATATNCSKGLQASRMTEARDLMISLVQGKMDLDTLVQRIGSRLGEREIALLYSCICNRPLKYRNRAVAILAHHLGIRMIQIASFLAVSPTSVGSWLQRFKRDGAGVLLEPHQKVYSKTKDRRFRDAVFEVLHAPPISHGINRTTWRLKDIQSVMAQRGLPIARSNISKIIKESGYRYRKAKTVLTSTDPEYGRKLKEITKILSTLSANQKFFSVDEFGPFAVKKRGGRSLAPRGHARTVPQRQRSKGCLIITGALELSTNTMIHFYSKTKNTREMIKLLNLLVKKYAKQERIYFSWDAASWHASKELYARVDEINSTRKSPHVKLAPLPCCAQFLNVIESVFSGMARAVLHNSDYPSVTACKKAIDRHFAERNRDFRRKPKRAGNKIWGKERVEPRFRESNNCKDPRYR